MRARVFGDLIFVDHVELRIEDNTFVVLIIVDAASNFLCAAPQKDKTNKEEQIRLSGGGERTIWLY